MQECRNFNIWGYALRSKRFEGSRLYSKIIWGLQATKRWGSGLHGKNFRAPGLRPPPTFGTLFFICISYWESIGTLCNAWKTACLLAALVSDPVQLSDFVLNMKRSPNLSWRGVLRNFNHSMNKNACKEKSSQNIKRARVCLSRVLQPCTTDLS